MNEKRDLTQLIENEYRHNFSEKEVGQLRIVLLDVFESQRTYGRSVNSLDAYIRNLLRVVRDHSMFEVVKAIFTWQEQSNQMPSPADIIQILDPSKKPKVRDAAMRVAIEKERKETHYISKAQQKYIDWYDGQILEPFKEEK